MPLNPLKTTTAEIYHSWQEELSQLQRRWNEIKANAQEERGEGNEEAEGLRSRLQGLRDLIAEAMVIGEEPASWRVESPVVRLGSMVRLEFEDGAGDDFLFVGLAGPTAAGNVLTPKTPLGAAILGRKAGETVAYRVGQNQFQVVIRQCLVPGDPAAIVRPAGQRGVQLLAGEDENDEAARVSFRLLELLNQGTPAPEAAVSWRGPFQSRSFETAFTNGGIRYRLEGVDGFYDLPAVQGILALLRLLVEPGDGAALFLALRTFTHAPIEALEQLAAGWRGPEQSAVPGALARDKGVACVLQTLQRMWPESAKLTPTEVLSELGRRLGRLRPDLVRDRFRSPWPAVMQATRHHKGLRGFLAHTKDVAGRSQRGARDGLVMTPLDLLGGRKFSVLFLVGANEGALPLLTDEQDSLSTERELFYGVLGAASTTILSWARTIEGKPAERSRFIGEAVDTWGMEDAE